MTKIEARLKEIQERSAIVYDMNDCDEVCDNSDRLIKALRRALEPIETYGGRGYGVVFRKLVEARDDIERILDEKDL